MNALKILSIHLKKRNHRDELFTKEDIATLAQESKSFTGAELEEVVKEALFMAFSHHRELALQDLQQAIQATTPLSVNHERTH